LIVFILSFSWNYFFLLRGFDATDTGRVIQKNCKLLIHFEVKVNERTNWHGTSVNNVWSKSPLAQGIHGCTSQSLRPIYDNHRFYSSTFINGGLKQNVSFNALAAGQRGVGWRWRGDCVTH
jgi:hypothetical protein